MALNRRNVIRGAAGLLVAAGAGELLLPERRPIFALDRTMMERKWVSTAWIETPGAYEVWPIALDADGKIRYLKRPWYEIAKPDGSSYSPLTSFKIEVLTDRSSGSITSAVARTKHLNGADGPVVVLR